MLRVIHCITTITRGGAENQLLILSREQIKSGRKVTIIYLNGKPELRQDFIDSGIEVLPAIDENLVKGIAIPINNSLKNDQEVVGLLIMM